MVGGLDERIHVLVGVAGRLLQIGDAQVHGQLALVDGAVIHAAQHGRGHDREVIAALVGVIGLIAEGDDAAEHAARLGDGIIAAVGDERTRLVGEEARVADAVLVPLAGLRRVVAHQLADVGLLLHDGQVAGGEVHLHLAVVDGDHHVLVHGGVGHGAAVRAELLQLGLGGVDAVVVAGLGQLVDVLIVALLRIEERGVLDVDLAEHADILDLIAAVVELLDAAVHVIAAVFGVEEDTVVMLERPDDGIGRVKTLRLLHRDVQGDAVIARQGVARRVRQVDVEPVLGASVHRAGQLHDRVPGVAVLALVVLVQRAILLDGELCVLGQHVAAAGDINACLVAVGNADICKGVGGQAQEGEVAVIPGINSVCIFGLSLFTIGRCLLGLCGDHNAVDQVIVGKGDLHRGLVLAEELGAVGGEELRCRIVGTVIFRCLVRGQNSLAGELVDGDQRRILQLGCIDIDRHGHAICLCSCCQQRSKFRINIVRGIRRVLA